MGNKVDPYTQLDCSVCQKLTWHYTANGVTRCTVHTSNLLQGAGAKYAETKVSGVVSEPVRNGFVDRFTVGEQKQIANGKTITKAGFHDAFCDTCAGVTIHYKGHGSNDQVHCSVCFAKEDAGRKQKLLQDSSHIIQNGTMGKRPFEAPTEGELRRLNKMNRLMLRAAEQPIADRVYLDDLDWDSPTEAPLDPDKAYCSFCGDQTERLNLTTERTPKIRKRIEVWKDSNGEVQTKEKVHAVIETVYACPKCCLNIRKPITVHRV